VRENLERYKNEQSVINSERQLSGKVIGEDVVKALQRTGYMISQHLILINTVLTMAATTVEAEYQRRIAAINAMAHSIPSLGRECSFSVISVGAISNN
jgi:predicted ABC-type ATPase